MILRIISKVERRSASDGGTEDTGGIVFLMKDHP